MKKTLALFLSAVLLLTVSAPVAFAGVEYTDTYETAISLAKNNLADLDSLDDAVTMLDSLGYYGFSRRYVSYFRQLILLQGEDPDLAAAATMLELCRADGTFTADLAARGLPSCDDLLRYIGAREQERAGKLRAAMDAYGRLTILDSFDRAADLAMRLAETVPETAPQPEPAPAPLPGGGKEGGSVSIGVRAGDEIVFGRYEQNNRTDSPEDIVWLVLEVRDGSALLISKYALDCLPYNDPQAGVTWETCTLRGWLNDTFLNTAFGAEEQAKIPAVTVSAEANPSYGTDPGNSTTDRVFLLSIAEAERYFASDADRKCPPTDRAKARDGREGTDYETCWWWLRSPGGKPGYAADVGTDGSVSELGCYVYTYLNGVRPAMWIDLAS